jgi:hypothetical protein
MLGMFLPTNCLLLYLIPNVIYSITCLKCKSQYIGETKRQIRKIIYKYIRTIDNNGKPGILSTPVSEHFNIQCKIPAKHQFFVLETIMADPLLENTTISNRKRKLYWILTLRTLERFGVNIHA